jgi:LPS export ABC transporter protein LptC
MKINSYANKPPGRFGKRPWLWLLAVALVLVVGVWGLAGRRTPPPPPPKPAPAAEKSGGRMQGLSLTEIQEGDRRWVLEATKADFHKDQLEVSISGVRVEFFGPGEHVKVKADEGLFNTKTRGLTLKGRVELQRGEMLITTSTAIYQPEGRLLLAPEDVTMEEPGLRVEGKGLTVQLADKKLVLAQHRLTEVKTQGWGLKK